MTNKNGHEGQIAKKQGREEKLGEIKTREPRVPREEVELSQNRKRGRPRKDAQAVDPEALPATPMEAHHHMSQGSRDREDILKLVIEHPDDPALKVGISNLMRFWSLYLHVPQNFIPDLNDHLLARILEQGFNGEEHHFTDEERSHLTIAKGRMYRHKILRVNYTTYDMRRDQDTISPRTRPDIMVLNPGEDDISERRAHPYWYARVCGIFHVNVEYTGPAFVSKKQRRMEFLWVRWYGRDLGALGGFGRKRLHRVGFVDADEPGAFGFLDPALVLRGAHLIPAFAHGRTKELMGPSVMRSHQEPRDDADWRYHYVNM